MKDSGVLFPDAGRTRNPYNRTEKSQREICAYLCEAVRLWVRARATASASAFATWFSELCTVAKLVASAAKWSLQAKFPNDPIFVGPVCAADIIRAGLLNAVKTRYSARLDVALGEGDVEATVPQLSFGEAVQAFAQWAASVQAVDMAPLKKIATEAEVQRALDSEHRAERC